MSKVSSLKDRYQALGVTHTGKVREHNEDTFAIDEKLGLFIVCDGMGGLRAGEVASNLTCRTIHRHIQQNHEELKAIIALTDRTQKRHRAIAMIHDALELANTEIRNLSQSSDDKRRMGSTVVVMLLLGRQALITHVGDSRIYLIRQHKIHQLTADHLSVDRLLKLGRLTPTEAKALAGKSSISRAVGTKDTVKPESFLIDLISRDRFLLCSDGLTLHLTDEQMLGIFNQSPGTKAAPKLIKKANDEGGMDNITAAVIAFGAGDAKADDQLRNELELLGSSAPFRHYTYVELLHIFGHASIRDFKRHGNIINEGDPNPYLWVCLDGSAQLVKQGQVICEIGPGEFFGEMSVIRGNPAWVDVIALQDTRVLAIDRPYLLSMLNEEPHLSARLLWRLTCSLIDRLYFTSEELGWSIITAEDSWEDSRQESFLD